MVRVLYGVSAIGLGHASRALVVVGALRAAGADVKVYSGTKVAAFLAANGDPALDILPEPAPRVVGGEMKGASLWYLRSWLSLRKDARKVAKLIEDFRPDVLVGDEEFSGLVSAGRTRTRRIMVTDELQLGFARSWLARSIESRVYRWYVEMQRSVDLLIVPEEGEDKANMKYVGPIVRRQSRSPDEVRSAYGLPAGPLILVSLSGSGMGRELVGRTVEALDPAGLGSAFVVVTGNRGRSLAGPRVFDLGVVPDNQNLVFAADLVVSLAGKSTIDEAAAAGTPIVAVPIKNHAEQERNAGQLGYSRETLADLQRLLRSMTGRRGAPREFDGAERAARLIMSVAAAH